MNQTRTSADVEEDEDEDELEENELYWRTGRTCTNLNYAFL